MNPIEWLIYAAAWGYVTDYEPWRPQPFIVDAARVVSEFNRRLECTGNAVVSLPLARDLSLKA